MSWHCRKHFMNRRRTYSNMVKEHSITPNVEAAVPLSNWHSPNGTQKITILTFTTVPSLHLYAPNTIMSEQSTHWMDVPPDYSFHFFSLIHTKPWVICSMLTCSIFSQHEPHSEQTHQGCKRFWILKFVTVNYGKYSLLSMLSLLSAHTSLRTQPFLLLNYIRTLSAYIKEHTPTNKCNHGDH
jgi:hypothetical protein